MVRTRDRAGHLFVLCCHFFEDMMATFRLHGILGALLLQRNTCAGCWPWKPRGSEYSGPSWASHCGPSPPVLGHGGHLTSTWYGWRGCGNIIQHPVCFPTALEENTGWISTRDVSSVCTSALCWHTLSGSHIFRRTRRCSEKPLRILPSLCRRGREVSIAQDKAEHLKRTVALRGLDCNFSSTWDGGRLSSG